MRLNENIYLVGGGETGFGISHPLDCHVYLITDGESGALIDSGVGIDDETIIQNILAEGLSLDSIKQVLLTHAHADHSGGSAGLRERLGLDVSVPKGARRWLEEADEDALYLTHARAGGRYPADYRFRAVEVAHELSEGDEVHVGSITLGVIETPGHSQPHISYTYQSGGRSHLFAGDLVFHGGTILLLNTAECSITAYAESVGKFRDYGLDALLPGHGTLDMSGGQAHFDAALARFDQLSVPPNYL